tara:strand:- start:292 stop:576 length:285 start_codon:yes stop_codon:yes gene_type:complete
MNHSQEEIWVTGKLGTKESTGYRTSIWTPVEEDELNDNRQKYIDAGWKSYCWTKGSAGYDKYFLSKLPKEEFKHLLMVEKEYGYHTMFWNIDED